MQINTMFNDVEQKANNEECDIQYAKYLSTAQVD
jgi:hypothetical protein